MSSLDTIFKASIVVAAASVGYYFAIYLPQRDATRDRAELEKARARELEKTQASNAYALCLNAVNANHRANWNLNCKLIADLQKSNTQSANKAQQSDTSISVPLNAKRSTVSESQKRIARFPPESPTGSIRISRRNRIDA